MSLVSFALGTSQTDSVLHMGKVQNEAVSCNQSGL